MEHPKVPVGIAREAIRRLSSRLLPPTPDNFRQAYAEVSGVVAVAESSAQAQPEPCWPDLAIRASDLSRASAGVTERIIGEDGKAMLAQADDAIHNAKSLGRNRVERA